MATNRARRPTAKYTEKAKLDGDKLYLQRARIALPILVRQALAAQPITYGDLAREMGMPNPRNLNYVLGAIGNAIIGLGRIWNAEIPPIQALVFNKNSGLPGEGIEWFAPDAHEFKEATSRQRRVIVNRMLDKVFAYNQWDKVITHFQLKMNKERAKSTKVSVKGFKYGDSGESPEHKSLKEYVSANPHILGLPRSIGRGTSEYLFPSADAIDVLFHNSKQWVGAEVKSSRSSIDDIQRGLFQCVKYQALAEATQASQSLKPNAVIFLVMDSTFPKELIWLKNTLGIEVIDNVNISSSKAELPDNTHET